MGTAIFAGAVFTQELQYGGNTILNITVPAAVAAALGTGPAEAAKKAAEGAHLTNAIPGGRAVAERVAEIAQAIASSLSGPDEGGVRTAREA
jgi:methylthioribose-1-phosphate isomerase